MFDPTSKEKLHCQLTKGIRLVHIKGNLDKLKKKNLSKFDSSKPNPLLKMSISLIRRQDGW